METQKERKLAEVLDYEFDLNKYAKFSSELFNKIEVDSAFRRTSIWKEYEKHIAAYYRVGSYIDEQQKKILILAVEIKKEKSVERARTMQRNFISRLLSESNNFDSAFVAFYSPEETNWRLSFVRLDYTFGEAGLELDLTPARRYSYLIGEGEPSHTAKTQLLPIFENDRKNPTIEELENAFSVEKVTKDFFDQYKLKYLQLKEYLEQDFDFINETKKLGFEVPVFAEQFSKKLMGQLAFLYFLQKKGWLGVKIVPRKVSQNVFKEICNLVNQPEKEILKKVYQLSEENRYNLNTSLIASNKFSDYEAEMLTNIFVNKSSDKEWGTGYKRFIYDILWRHCEENDGNFFDDYLEPFFYEALNKKRANHYFKKFNCKIPFLNGGLFEPLEGYNWKGLNFNIPNELFSNKSKKGKKSDGILDIFERFNFTINEDEPLEKEVAVDPEMLGKIFENLLEVKDRKSKGAFYTPREIVHYICQESLINYLVNKVLVPYEDMKEFVLYSDLIRDTDSRSGVGFSKNLKIKDIIYKNMINIDQALKKVKIADPAVGSGAFSLGMLSEIVRLRNNITDYLVKLDNQGELGRRYGEIQLRKKRSLYDLKIYTIQHSIFAVDVDNSAVDITKLRLWLSVVVDEVITEETPFPQPLPNLEMNIMVGDSLVDEYEGIKLFDETVLHKNKQIINSSDFNYHGEFRKQIELFVDQSDEMLEEMFKLQDRYFDEEDSEKKVVLKKRIENVREQLIEYKLNREGNQKGYESYQTLKKDKKAPYFLWYLEFAKVFKDNGGFDIVIGNPPYVGFHKVPNKLYFKEKYLSARGKYDFYVLFIERGLNLLNNKGILSYICPSYFYKRNYGKNIRNLLLEETKINFICDFQDVQIFDSALTYTCIFSIEKNKDNQNHNIRVITNNLYGEEHLLNQNTLKEPAWSLENDQYQEIIKKVKMKCQKELGSITKSISQGIVTGNNDIFIQNENFIKENNMNFDFFVEIFKGRDIRNGKLISQGNYLFYPYRTNENGENVLILEDEIREKNPNLYEYLLSKKSKLLSRGYFLKSNKKWYELWNPRNKSHFESEKYVFSEINDRNDFVLTDACYYSDSACGMELKDDFVDYKIYLQRYLNSDIITALYKKLSVPKANGYLIFKNAFLKGLPVYLPDNYEEIVINEKNFDKYLIKIFGLSEEEVQRLLKG
ncbi:adenine-specific DNA-methyltransferase [Exiguobacterium sp. PvP048]|uniref:Eco57I restriction-modification methylase domain-containing protein n=1 Tax=unclassified Exiguobacterium TaxID=2644629 RepID=UPI00339B0937